jgi:hypothetical protein
MADPLKLIESLKDLAVKHSYMKVHMELLALMKQEYTALKGFFEAEVPKKKVSVKATEVVAPVEAVPAKVLANTKIKIIKNTPDQQQEQQQEQQQGSKPRMDSKELKAWQKEQEAKKLAELTAAGTNPESLLTAESIKCWIEDEGRTFAYVAREYVGLPEATVADFAKSHGVKSKISKSRAILSAKNRRV